ncbi:MAG: winged helix-turn-helix transcriptional regulator [Deltaproteobacteria bacterium]|nr:winged helix-turn-helix transcriptional regulator [Deltaproteobacteria bacterium]
MPEKSDREPMSGEGSANLGSLEKKLINLLSGDLGDSERPYQELAEKIGVSEETVLAMIADFQKRGLIRRLGAVVVHQRSGFNFNAMVVWPVPEGELDRVGRTLAALPFVSHCYHRAPTDKWPYTLYTMIHARNREELSGMIQKMSDLSGVKDWRSLKSVKELKKTSLRYFGDAPE